MRLFRCIPWLLLPLSGYALNINGTAYLELREVAAQLGMKSKWVEKDKVLRLESEWTRLTFEVHKREMELNGTRIHLGFPVVESHGQLHLSESDFAHQLRPLLTPQLNGPPPGLRHIVLDPGHGGKDPGAENKPLGLREKALTLDLAKRVKRHLEAKGFIVSLTRDQDVFVSLEERGRQANQLRADLFVSLHFNALDNKSVSGIETYAFTPLNQPSSARSDLHESDREAYPGQKAGAWSALVAYYVQRSLVDGVKSSDRGLKRARFTVLRDLEMPGLLVEGGFITSSTEGRNIGSASYRDTMARAIVDGILVYQNTLDRLRGGSQR